MKMNTGSPSGGILHKSEKPPFAARKLKIIRARSALSHLMSGKSSVGNNNADPHNDECSRNSQ